MARKRNSKFVLLLCAAVALSGCHGGEKKITYLGDAELNYYRDYATSIAYPHHEEPPNANALITQPPRRVSFEHKDNIWDLPLVEAIHTALQNSQVLRERDQFLSPRNLLLINPDVSGSVYDPAIQSTDVLLGTRGVEAALADFDAQFSTGMTWGRSEQVQNNLFNAGLAPGATLVEDTGNFTSRIDKQFAYGGTFGVQHNWNYSWNNSPARLFPSVYEGFLRAEYRQPLLAGAGRDYTAIAGPISPNLRDIFGVNQGVVIARINNDIAIADFEIALRTLIRDVEASYWDLALAYRVYDTEVSARNASLQTWRQAQIKAEQGLEGGGAADVAQAEEAYLQGYLRADNALGELYRTEMQLRRVLNLPVNDGRVIRPCDEPTTAEYLPDWEVSLVEGIVERPELRRQKWTIKSIELQLDAARSLTRPRLDFVSSYQVNGFGDQLFGENDDDERNTEQGLDSAYETLSQGDQTSWTLGFELSVPIGLRRAHTQVRNLELRLARARIGLDNQEHEISHEIAAAFQTLDRSYAAARTAFNVLRVARERVQAVSVEYDQAGRVPLDVLVRAQLALAQAEVAYHQNVVEYNRAIMDVQYRKGTILSEYNIKLAEGPWVPEAYKDALRRAWARSFAFEGHQHDTNPEPFSSEVPLLPGTGSPIPPESVLEATPGEGTFDRPPGAVESLPAPPAPADAAADEPAANEPATAPTPAKPVPQAPPYDTDAAEATPDSKAGGKTASGKDVIRGSAPVGSKRVDNSRTDIKPRFGM